MDFGDFTEFVPINPNTGKKIIKKVEEPKIDIIAVIKEQQKKKAQEETYEEENLYPVKYNDDTMKTYKTLRITKQDVIFHTVTNERNSFRFYDMWDPYTGEITGRDPYGPLCFTAYSLVQYFYTKRLKHIWVEETDEADGYYEGYPDDGVGAGEDFLNINRGEDHPEWYLFRLPIIDCYLCDGYDRSVITMGPKLTDRQIEEIDMKAMDAGARCSLVTMKKYYDIIISDEIGKHIYKPSNMTMGELKQADYDNKISTINLLRKMRF